MVGKVISRYENHDRLFEFGQSVGKRERWNSLRTLKHWRTFRAVWSHKFIKRQVNILNRKTMGHWSIHKIIHRGNYLLPACILLIIIWNNHFYNAECPTTKSTREPRWSLRTKKRDRDRVIGHNQDQTRIFHRVALNSLNTHTTLHKLKDFWYDFCDFLPVCLLQVG